MSAELRPRVSNPLAAPPVNAKTAPARVIPENMIAWQRSASTAGASSSIAMPANAWDRYVADAGIVGFDVVGDPVHRAEPGWARTPGARDREGIAGTDERLFKLTVGPTLRVPTSYPYDSPEAKPVNLSPGAKYRTVRQQVARARREALIDIRRQLDAGRAAETLQSPRSVVDHLAGDLGVSQLAIGRAVGVTPTAVRKWRRGEPAKPEHRDRLARLAAMCDLLSRSGIHDPAGWIEIPISGESTLTPLDLFIAGRADLAVLLGAGLSDPQETLDDFDSDWRRVFARDPDYEVVTLQDGSRSVVPIRPARD
jgi:transcriptional regulator with XRE-family HTH domain